MPRAAPPWAASHAVCALASTALSLVAAYALGAKAIVQVTRGGQVYEPDTEARVWAVALTVLAVALSCGVVPVRDQVSRVVVRLGQVLTGVVLAVSGYAISAFMASLPAAADGCAGAECWTSRSVGWVTASPLVVTALGMVLVGALCRNPWVGRLVLPPLAAASVWAYFHFWDPYLLDFVTGPAPAWFA